MLQKLSLGRFGVIALFAAALAICAIAVPSHAHANYFQAAYVSGANRLLVEKASSNATLKANDPATTADDAGVFTIKFNVTAATGDAYITGSARRSGDLVLGSEGIEYVITATGEAADQFKGTSIASVSSDAKKENGRYKVGEGETRTFTLTVEYDPASAGLWSMKLFAIHFNTVNEKPNAYMRPQPEANFVTGLISIANEEATKTDIRVTAPNGGEQWESGVLNTVTWTPYQYNPDINPARDVTAYLEKKNTDGSFKTLGKVQESGKASIHWITGELNSATGGGSYVPVGDGYYVRVVNNVTGATDRSDAPFTILPKPIRLLVNGSADLVAIPNVDQKITISWTTNPGVSTCQLSGLKGIPFSKVQPSNGSITGLPEYTVLKPEDGGGIAYGIKMQCVRMVNGTPVQISEYARFRIDSIPTKTASLQIISPNGGEKWTTSDTHTITWKQSGLSSASVALYKDEKWNQWINKNALQGSNIDGKQSLSWMPKDNLAGSGSVYKIYITGQKTDGSGYIDDKSDATFSLIPFQTPKPTKAPGKNIFSCNRSVANKIGDAKLACYGMWDYGEDFGGDVNMCGDYAAGKIGCKVKAPVCSSGSATATLYLGNGSLARSSDLGEISKNLGVSDPTTLKGIAGLWKYTCLQPSGAVRGASTTDMQELLNSMLMQLQQMLEELKSK